MEVISEGANIGISFSGISGLFIIIGLVMEIISLLTTKTFLLHKIFLYFSFNYRVRKLLPDWWKVKYVGIIIYRVRYNRWVCMLR